jgi:epsin
MLRQFHFIDQNGKDQGINVRNRAKELAELLGDVEKIRSERKKARANRSKFGGVEGGPGLNSGFTGSGGGGGGGGSGSRYGGFGSEQADYGGYSGGVYGDGGGFGGDQASSGFSDTQARKGGGYEEYDEYDEGETTASPVRRKEPAASSTARIQREIKKEEPKPKAKEPVPDLLAWDDEPAPVSSSAGKQPVAAGNDFGADDDDFDDFQSAAPAAPAASLFAKPPGATPFIAPPNSTSTITSSTQFAAPQPHSGAQSSNLNDLFATVSPTPAGNRFAAPPMSAPTATSSIAQPFAKPAGFQQSGPNYFTSVPVGQNTSQSAGSTPSIMSSGMGGIGGKKIGAVAPKASGGDAFASLLSTAAPRKTNTPTQKVTMADMAKQKTSAGLWGAPVSGSSTPAAQAPNSKPGGALGDLLG